MAKRETTRITEPEPAVMRETTPEPAPQVTAIVKSDVNPQLAFAAAWDKDPGMREVLTRTGQLRGGLKPSQMERAKKILEGYGL